MNASNPIRSSRESAPAVLRGTQHGLEILIGAQAAVEEISDALTARLEQCPEFFAGSDVAVRCDGALPPGMLGRLEAIAARYDLRITEVGRPLDMRASLRRPVDRDDAPTDERSVHEDEEVSSVLDLAASMGASLDAATVAQPSLGSRLVAGPIRSGCFVEAEGHLVVLGDVNPGAELRARGSVVILGSLRGTAHASVDGENAGFILALRLSPQQLRIGNLIARTGDATPPDDVEIAYAVDGQIVVETYRGRLPSGISLSPAGA